MVSPREYAALHNVPYSTVMSWIRGGLLPGVVEHTRPLLWYEVPADAKPPERKRGPKPGSKK